MEWFRKMYARIFPASKYQVNDFASGVYEKLDGMEKELRQQAAACRKLCGEMEQMKKELKFLRGGAERAAGVFLAAEKRKTPVTLLNFVYHLADHCNLNCRCCDHFSPIAEDRFADIHSFQRDMKRLGELCGGYAKRINLQGGEPLLHPQALDFAVIAREHFPKGEILFTTNGILLLKQQDQFWKTCAEYGISIEITKYPIAVSYEKIKEKADAFGTACSFYGSSGKKEKRTYRIPLDLTGKQDIYSNFQKCSHANNCIMLKDGRLYTCTVAPNIEHFNRYFGSSLYLSDRDSIDIYEAGTIEEITDFLAKPIPFCRYCNVNGREYGLEWGQSARDLSEWVK